MLEIAGPFQVVGSRIDDSHGKGCVGRHADDPLFELALRLEEIALKDDYFVEKKLYPNVDFYSGIIYRALGIPIEMFTVMFALGRLPGWIAQFREMRLNHEPIGRPRQVYVGENHRPFIPLKDR